MRGLPGIVEPNAKDPTGNPTVVYATENKAVRTLASQVTDEPFLLDTIGQLFYHLSEKRIATQRYSQGFLGSRPVAMGDLQGYETLDPASIIDSTGEANFKEHLHGSSGKGQISELRKSTSK